MKTRTVLIGVIAIGLWLPLQALGQTTISNGSICTDTTWTESGSPYLVNSSVLIGCNATLTIEPGTEVRFSTGLGITVGHAGLGAGTLIARGTPEQRVHFSSSVSPQTPGAWARILFTDFTIDADFDVQDNFAKIITNRISIPHATENTRWL